MPANVKSMAYYGEIPWHGLGKAVPKGLNAEEMIRAAGLDWKVEKRPAPGARKINSKGDFSRYQLVRLAQPASAEVDTVLGIVSHRYNVLQNSDAFKFFDPIVKEGRAYFETAGALGDGEKVWVLARMPEALEIVHGDECYKYLLLSNNHNGEGSVTIKFTAVRVVCQNTLILALKDGQKVYRVRHTQGMLSRLEEISRLIAATQNIFAQAEILFKRLARVQIPKMRLIEYLDAVYPRTEQQKEENKYPRNWEEILRLIEILPNLQLPGVRGTLWGAYNAITYFEDYKQPPAKEEPERRLDRVWFGYGADIKLKALQKAFELSRTWLN